MFTRFPFVAQHDAMDCGPACLAMIAKSFGKKYPLQYLREYAYLARDGVSLSGLTQAAEKIGLEPVAVKISIDTLKYQQLLPCILYWNKQHFIIVHKIKKKLLSNRYIFKITDPSAGHLSIPEDRFKNAWQGQEDLGVALLLKPTNLFYELIPPTEDSLHLRGAFKYLVPHKWDVFQLALTMAIASLLTLIFPFLTQALIDKGVMAKNVHIVFIILLSQILLFLGTTIIDIVRNWLILYIGARINISIISDFFKKIMKLPIKFFDTKFKGDFYQRIQDHSRIHQFLTSQSLTTFFSLINFLIFFFALFHYNYKILLVYISLTLIAIVWSRFFLRKREYLDYFRFRSSALNQESINEILSGIHEIKLNNFEDYKRQEWEDIQVKVFNINLRVLRLDQTQLIGYEFINQLKNIIVTFLAANEVVKGNITIGAMLAISYIIGQMNSPINQLIAFFRSLQDAQLSLKRLVEVQQQKEEEDDENIKLLPKSFDIYNGKKGIRINGLYFQYDGPKSPFVLKNINIFIPQGKTTAIVGGSGSGKTTLMKLLLRFYNPVKGDIYINQNKLSEISPSSWRANCGVVMQDGYIFADSIYRNIATNDAQIDYFKMANAIKIANISEYIESIPQKGETKIGAKGNGISGGQRQRILIARAVYKQPQYVFFDEATSSLDTENEKIIYDNLQSFFRKKTVIIIAHRLSTVKNADQIVVLKDGQVVEIGTHATLTKSKGNYYNLVKNQLELET
jgi:ATP-binding cassette, subfamily B, bacterial